MRLDLIEWLGRRGRGSEKVQNRDRISNLIPSVRNHWKAQIDETKSKQPVISNAFLICRPLLELKFWFIIPRKLVFHWMNSVLVFHLFPYLSLTLFQTISMLMRSTILLNSGSIHY